jgi:hypothetical protein
VPSWLKQLLSWQKQLTGTIDLDQQPAGHGRGIAWIAVAASVVVGSLLSIQDWQAVGDQPQFERYLIVDAIAAVALTPLAVTIFLTLRELTTRLLKRLDDDGVIEPVASGKKLNQVARDLDDRLDDKWAPTAAFTAVYVTYTAADALNELDGPLTTLLTAITLVVQAALLYLGVLAVAQVWVTCRAIGELLREREFEVRVQPLHPDGCGGLWPVGHMLSLVLYVAAILGGAGLCIFLALEGTPSPLTRRPEPYLLGVFYAILLPSAFLNLLWRPHQLMLRRRAEILTPVAREFNAAIIPRELPATDDSERLRAKADSPSEIARKFGVLDEACPAWPLRVRRLQSVIATAVLPVAIPIVTAVITSFLTPTP